MELHIKERLVIPVIFPQKGTLKDFSTKKGILKKILLTDEDIEKYSIKQGPESEGSVSMSWDIDKDLKEPLKVDLSSDELEYINKCCEDMSDSVMSDDVWEVVNRIYNAQ